MSAPGRDGRERTRSWWGEELLGRGADRALWAFDRGTSKMLKYDLDGNFQYAWGTWGDFPGGFWGVHGLAVDQAGNFYVAEVDSGREQAVLVAEVVVDERRVDPGPGGHGAHGGALETELREQFPRGVQDGPARVRAAQRAPAPHRH